MIVAIVVTYFPDFVALHRLIEAVSVQVDHVVVVDNASVPDVVAWVNGRFAAQVSAVRLSDNSGVAAAQNAGIRIAREHGAEYVILFDQDSLPAPDMVRRLHTIAVEQAATGISVAAVGPRFVDIRRQATMPFTRVKGLRVCSQCCQGQQSAVEVDYLISSGCLIPVTALDRVGGMNEALFIDYVDIEWGLRARHAGLRSFGGCDVEMHHHLGDEPLRFMGRTVSQHPPLRRYYHFRNAVWLYRQSWPPLNWKCVDACRLLVRYGFYTLFSPPRFQQWRMMTQGIWHGLTGRMGRR